MKMTNSDTDDKIEYDIFEDVIGNQCSKHMKLKTILCTIMCYKENVKSTNVRHISKGRYYDHAKPSQNTMVNENTVQEANEKMDQMVNENRLNHENAPKINDEILNSFDTKEIEWLLHSQDNPQLALEFHEQNDSRLDISLPHDIPVLHVHNLESPYKINYSALDHPQHAKVIATCQIKDIKRFENKQAVNLRTVGHNGVIDQETFTNLYQCNIEPSSFIHALYITGHENNATIFSGEVFWQFPYHSRGLTIENYARELNIPAFLDNGWMFSIMSKHFYERHEILWNVRKYWQIIYSYTCGTEIKFIFW